MQLPDKRENFSDWYNEVIELAELSDKRYAIKGMNVWRPYGWKIMTSIDSIIRAEMDKRGFLEVSFPLLISEQEFAKEKEHIKGFDEQVYWVTHAGGSELDVKLLLRPTSETAMYPIFALWVRSHADLPLRTYQIVNTFRYETKQTRPFIRVREIHFFEAHTCHKDYEDAERQIREYFEIFEAISQRLALPYVLTKRPEWDKFAGAYYTVGIDVLMPNGRTLQVGSVHQYRTNFSEAYGIKYEDVDGSHKYFYQTTFGLSERLLGAIVGLHGDNRGLVLPPEIAPMQVVVVPVLKKGKKRLVTRVCRETAKQLAACFRVHLDERELRPGSKYYDWELRGVPLRVEIGPADIARNVAVLVRRDTGEELVVPLTELAQKCASMLAEVSRTLYLRASAELRKGVGRLGREVAVVRAGWCGAEACAGVLEERLARKTLGESLRAKKNTCAVCAKATRREIYLSKMY